MDSLWRTIKELRDHGLQVIGLETLPQAQLYYEADFRGPLALVVGGEGEGLTHLVKENCSSIVRLPMAGRVTSLNTGVAAGIALYEVLRQRGVRGRAQSGVAESKEGQDEPADS